MKPEAQRIAIAEECGWKRDGSRFTKGNAVAFFPPVFCEGELPDFVNDLNAAHEAVMALDVVMRGLFNAELMRPFEKAPFCLDKTINATAAQRAEAFLRALGKWTEEP